MLVLARRVDEEVLVFDEHGQVIMRIAVVSIGTVTRLGFEAPPQLKIMRGELCPGGKLPQSAPNSG